MSRRLAGATRHRSGFALLAVLWTLTGMAALTLLLESVTREAIGASRNRVDAVVATWIAEGCLAESLAAIDDTLATTRDVEAVWNGIDDLFHETRIREHCDVALRPSGITLDVNGASRDRLATLFLATGLTVERADSLAAALVDWRDADDIPSPNGAEAAWYRAAGRATPRNGAFLAPEEVRLVRGFEQPSAADTLLGVERDRILLTRAPAPVLATVPGLGREAIAVLVEHPASEIYTLHRLALMLSPDARKLLEEHQMELASLATMSPDAWIITSSVRRSSTSGTSSVELRIVRAGRRAAVTHHRSRPWS